VTILEWVARGDNREDTVTKGVLASTVASTLFAVMFYYVTLMEPLAGVEIFGWRMLLNAPVITLLVVLTGDWRLVGETLARVRRAPWLALGIVVCATLVGAQLLVFVWGPVNGHALDVSLGFFLMPLTLVLIGRVAFGERLTAPQRVAVALAVFGVGNELLRVGGVSWVTLMVAVGYPLYFALRRRLRTDHQGGVWIEMHLVVPVALALILFGANGFGAVAERTALLWLIPGLGIISALGLSLNFLSSRLLPFVLFGLLIYLEPVLLVFVALLLGERIAPGQWLTYLPIWTALAVLLGEGVHRLGAWRVLERRRAGLVMRYRAR
jgi:chloramphenicol-sensitive protein RarD